MRVPTSDNRYDTKKRKLIPHVTSIATDDVPRPREAVSLSSGEKPQSGFRSSDSSAVPSSQDAPTYATWLWGIKT